MPHIQDSFIFSPSPPPPSSTVRSRIPTSSAAYFETCLQDTSMMASEPDVKANMEEEFVFRGEPILPEPRPSYNFDPTPTSHGDRNDGGFSRSREGTFPYENTGGNGVNGDWTSGTVALDNGGSGAFRNGRKRLRDSLGNDRLDTKSPRFTPSPSTFASTPQSASPESDFTQNEDPEAARFFSDAFYYSPKEQQQILEDQEFARRIQEEWNQEVPSSNNSSNNYIQMERQIISPAMTQSAVSENNVYDENNTYDENNAYDYRSNTIDISSDEDSMELVELDQRDVPTSFVSLAYDKEPVNLNFSNITHNTPYYALDGIGMMTRPSNGWAGYVDSRGGIFRPFDQGSFISRPSSAAYSSGSSFNGGWPVPGGSSSLSGEIRNYADHVSNDPTKTLKEIKSLLANIRPDMEIPPENREGTPDAMVYNLMEHQKVGLTWLKKMEESNTKGGILADDMGLGKTIQTLALLVSRPAKDSKRKTTLIIAPVALMRQWEKEIKDKLKPDYRLSVYICHGNKKAKLFSDLASYDVVLTTFGTLASEYKRKEKYEKAKEDQRGPKPSLMLLGEDSHFYRVIIDEAQYIKNKDTQASKACWSLSSEYRWCLSGTPMQNSCDELYPLLRFLRIKPYSEWTVFSQTFSKPLKGRLEGPAKKSMDKFQALIKAILLRRTKNSEIDGHPILQLPPKEVTMIHSVFSHDEQEFYSSLESRSKILFNKYVKANSVGRNYSNLLVILLRLRQACCHPHLINDIEEPSDDVARMVALVRELSLSSVERIKQSDSLECPVCLDISTNPSIIIPCGHLFCKECLAQIQTQNEQTNLARGEESSKLKCPKCRADMDPKCITDLHSFKTVYPSDGETASDLTLNVDDDLIYDTESEDEGEEEDISETGDLKDFVVPDSAGDDYQPNPKDKALDAPKKSKSAPKKSDKGKHKSKGRTLAEVRKDAMRNEKSRKLYHKHLRRRWVDSAKITKCVEIIQRIQKNDPTEKTIIFSQFTSLLDLLEIPISNIGIAYRRYDGSMSAAKRNQALMDFQFDKSITVLLVSLKAGNSGLNLVAASQVIMFDPFYNPFIELQAIDRAHRIGQQRRVVVHQLIVPGTVEDRVLALQEKKRKLIEGALDENAQKGLGRLTAKDLGFLFGIDS